MFRVILGLSGLLKAAFFKQEDRRRKERMVLRMVDLVNWFRIGSNPAARCPECGEKLVECMSREVNGKFYDSLACPEGCHIED